MILMKRCWISEIIPLRHNILRPGLPIDSARFAEDELASTLHYGLFCDGLLSVCLTLLQSKLEEQNAWQLRGMATGSDVQGLGYGSRLVQFAALDAMNEDFSNIFWCNARLVAVPFYQKNGWEIISPMFEVPVFGPHHKMRFDGQVQS